ncbi:DNA-3-methyladenine glycosylase family protein [Fodinibius sediminis]|uniref:DNA-3-methyladenine glycosylase II n=1 Tax=Fodinibius sediminis TaxID=1214077 RepID=A0A521BGQ5_9BACT|nr:DNA-3-methyladenine glycosylase [Fodinibius sediminis]SMO46263.1 DNA-3-methyladenine glycosylase II [Fodinibius sediminis]
MPETEQTIYLKKPDLFSFPECLHFLDRGYDDCLYHIDINRKSVYKALKIGADRYLTRVSDHEDELKIEILLGDTSEEYEQGIKNYIIDWFDLKRDLKPFYCKLNNYENLSWMTNRYHGLRLMGIPDLFEALCWCVTGQQINLSFAYRLKRRLVEAYGRSVTYDGKTFYYFPEPEVLFRLEISAFRKLQFSRRKAEYIIGISQQFAEGEMTKKQLGSCENRTEMLKRLLKIRGVGEWTANYVLMKSMGRTDCVTYGDTGLQSSVSSLLELNRKPTRKEIERVFAPFKGWESYLNIYLWRSLG